LAKAKSKTYKLRSTVSVRVNEIDAALVTEIKKLISSGERPAVSLEGNYADGTGFTNEREITSPVTRESLAAQINDLRTTMEDTPLPWILNLVHPHQDPEESQSEGIFVGIQHVSTLAEFTA
jgi:hypothetical protein